MYTDPSGWTYRYVSEEDKNAWYQGAEFYNTINNLNNRYGGGGGSGGYGNIGGSSGYYYSDGNYYNYKGQKVSWDEVNNNYIMPNTLSEESFRKEASLSQYFICVGKGTIKSNGDVIKTDSGNKNVYQLFTDAGPCPMFILMGISMAPNRAWSWMAPSNIEKSKQIGATSDMVGNICAGLIVAPIAAIGAAEIAPLVAAAAPHIASAAKSAAVSAYFGAQNVSSNAMMLANWGQMYVAGNFWISASFGAADTWLNDKYNLSPDIPIYDPINNAGYNFGSFVMGVIITYKKSR